MLFQIYIKLYRIDQKIWKLSHQINQMKMNNKKNLEKIHLDRNSKIFLRKINEII